MALRDFPRAKELAAGAVKLGRHEEERLERDFNLVGAMRTYLMLFSLTNSL